MDLTLSSCQMISLCRPDLQTFIKKQEVVPGTGLEPVERRF